MSVRSQNNVAYGLTDALLNVPLMPIVANRAPTSNDMAPIGTIWVFKSQNLAYVITSIVNNEANWVGISQSAGDFVRYTLQTVDNTPTAIATFAMPASSAIGIISNMLATQSDFSGAASIDTDSAYRHQGAGPVEVNAVYDITQDFAGGNVDVNTVVVGNTIELQVTGIAATVINWTADVTTIIHT